MARGPGVEKQPRRLAGAGREDHDPGPDLDARARRGVDVGDAGGEPLGIGQDLARHGPGHDLRRPVFRAGGSSTEGVEKLESVVQPRPHWPQ